jgi:hypothetical protein
VHSSAEKAYLEPEIEAASFLLSKTMTHSNITEKKRSDMFLTTRKTVVDS